jgi:hypothetical protein
LGNPTNIIVTRDRSIRGRDFPIPHPKIELLGFIGNRRELLRGAQGGKHAQTKNKG